MKSLSISKNEKIVTTPVKEKSPKKGGWIEALKEWQEKNKTTEGKLESLKDSKRKNYHVLTKDNFSL